MKEARSGHYDLVEGNVAGEALRSGPGLARVREGDKGEDALREDDDCLGSWLSQRCGKGAGLGGSVPVGVLILDGVGYFPSLFALWS